MPAALGGHGFHRRSRLAWPRKAVAMAPTHLGWMDYYFLKKDRTMPPQPLTCPKCDGEMIQGFIPELGPPSFAQVTIPAWVEGTPQKSFWAGTKVPKDKVIPIGTFRCVSCGYLESYARPEFARQ
jgi:hypothetical protein